MVLGKAGLTRKREPIEVAPSWQELMMARLDGGVSHARDVASFG
jgi:hypothetical protein